MHNFLLYYRAMNEKILVVDDEEPIRKLLVYNLFKAGFECIESADGAEALAALHSHSIDLILLDLMLPDMSGLDVCRTVKKDNLTNNIPIIMLTAKSEESDIVEGLTIGADDYVTKPFSPKVLVARIGSVLRRKNSANIAQNDCISFKNLKVLRQRHEVFMDECRIDLSATEFELLELLLCNKGRVFTRSQIIARLRGGLCVTDRAVDVHILSLRRKLKANAMQTEDFIETVRGVGYRFIDE